MEIASQMTRDIADTDEAEAGAQAAQDSASRNGDVPLTSSVSA